MPYFWTIKEIYIKKNYTPESNKTKVDPKRGAISKGKDFSLPTTIFYADMIIFRGVSLRTVFAKDLWQLQLIKRLCSCNCPWYETHDFNLPSHCERLHMIDLIGFLLLWNNYAPWSPNNWVLTQSQPLHEPWKSWCVHDGILISWYVMAHFVIPIESG